MLFSHIFLTYFGLIAGLMSGLIAIAHAAQQQIWFAVSQTIISFFRYVPLFILSSATGSPGRVGTLLGKNFLRGATS